MHPTRPPQGLRLITLLFHLKNLGTGHQEFNRTTTPNTFRRTNSIKTKDGLQ